MNAAIFRFFFYFSTCSQEASA
ncbi:TPA_asm: pheST operon leader peptide PheM [Salmonella enterica subsp. enterica serovar Typhimurium str. SL1344]|nr:hypothetical protein [Salmonella enterica subsp. enterica serovar Miami]EBY0391509.1 hypothetical protein [Salmonella enterica subsp. enterica serovar Miami]HAD6782488.1 pheST operon leader peptide PheM [Salmonella enterica subsp. enterica serovar Typhimurium str. SL1344]HAD6900858.1 pheST operon leader peptide PheM [Salmonella enterica subsp. enterica serovar Typhimurium str. SL1344]